MLSDPAKLRGWRWWQFERQWWWLSISTVHVLRSSGHGAARTGVARRRGRLSVLPKLLSVAGQNATGHAQRSRVGCLRVPVLVAERRPTGKRIQHGQPLSARHRRSQPETGMQRVEHAPMDLCWPLGAPKLAVTLLRSLICSYNDQKPLVYNSWLILRTGRTKSVKKRAKSERNFSQVSAATLFFH